MGRSDELCSEEIKPSTTSFPAILGRIQKQTHEGIKDLSIGTKSQSCGDTEHSMGLALAGDFVLQTRCTLRLLKGRRRRTNNRKSSQKTRRKNVLKRRVEKHMHPI